MTDRGGRLSREFTDSSRRTIFTAHQPLRTAGAF